MFMFRPSNTDTNTDALERKARRGSEIRKRDVAFKRRADDYLARHSQTPRRNRSEGFFCWLSRAFLTS
jgi:hypothetical protein